MNLFDKLFSVLIEAVLAKGEYGVILHFFKHLLILMLLLILEE